MLIENEIVNIVSLYPVCAAVKWPRIVNTGASLIISTQYVKFTK